MNDARPETAPEVSIIIRAYNEERWLPELLAALDAQTFRDFEVLVVDSGSLDRTRDIAAAHKARIILLRSEDFTFGYSLNIGIEQARGRFMAIISAHCIPTDPEWLGRLVAPLREPANAMVFGGQRGHAISKFSESRDFERVFPDHALVMDDDHVFVNNANSAIRKDLWEQHRFDEGLPGLEDAEWAKYWIPRGLRVLYEPTACVFHIHSESWPQVRHRFHREGIAGRWTAVRIIRHIPKEVAREAWWTLADFWLALRAGKLRALAGEVWRYRYNKTIGIVKGILDSRVITNPSKRAELHFDKGFPAVVVRGPHAAAIEPRPIPTLKPGEILVRIAYTGVSGGDLDTAKYPVVPGREIVGTVVSLGKRDTGLAEGDRVVVASVQGCGICVACKQDNAYACGERREVGGVGIDGGYAEFFVTRSRYAHRIPENVALRRAVLTEPLAAVLKGLRRLGVAGPAAARARCAIMDADIRGLLAAKVLARRGYEVTLFGPEAAQLRALGPGIQISATYAGIKAFDWIIVTSPSLRAVEAIARQSAPDSSLLLLHDGEGHSRAANMETLVAFDKTVVGSVGSTRADFEEALAQLASLDIDSLIGSVYPLEQFASAWQSAKTRALPKVMLQVDASAA
jgi:D-arabinose 1-dehydrogenase-like Zn-dependent alcohol dehydrogenase/glycosyltransferase involved in cell wall biosynthesis